MCLYTHSPHLGTLMLLVDMPLSHSFKAGRSGDFTSFWQLWSAEIQSGNYKGPEDPRWGVISFAGSFATTHTVCSIHSLLVYAYSKTKPASSSAWAAWTTGTPAKTNRSWPKQLENKRFGTQVAVCKEEEDQRSMILTEPRDLSR